MKKLTEDLYDRAVGHKQENYTWRVKMKVTKTV